MPDAPRPVFLVDPDDPVSLAAWLRDHGFLEGPEHIRALEPAGPGNMNLTLRVDTGERTFILKQSRPWVERFPEIPAPAERAVVEAAFYRAVSADARLAGSMPRLIGVDPETRILILEDLGPAADLTDVYAGEPITGGERGALLGWLSRLHALELKEPHPLLENRAMRELNHEHIFDLPLRTSDGLDADQFTAGLEAVAAELRADRDYVAEVHALGQRYLGISHFGGGDQLLHGDYYPGSWLRPADYARAPHGIAIVDPEFCFVGPAAFDVGVMLAHAILAGGELEAEMDALSAGYAPPEAFDWLLAERFAGVEIMRRLIGVAQLPLTASLAQKTAWLQLSREMVLEPLGPR